jgi:ribulose 1,5-bisphosphate synthetase/thiazole synthase
VLDKRIDADVCNVGAASAGTTRAYFLAREGKSVVIPDYNQQEQAKRTALRGNQFAEALEGI